MKSFSILFLAFAFIACQPTPPPTTLIFSGKIENPKSDKLSIIGDDFRLSVSVAEDGSFEDTLEIPAGYYTLRHGEYTNIYLQPGFDLQMTLDTDRFDESIQYSGVGADENNYLAAKLLKEDNIIGDRVAFFSLDEESFLTGLEERIARLKQNLDSASVPADFKEKELKSIEYRRLLFLSQYTGSHSYYTKNDSFSVSETFLKPLEAINYDNSEDFAMYDSYRSLVDSRFLDYESLDQNPDTLTTVLGNIRALKSQNIKNALVKTLSVFFLSPANPQVTTLYNGIMELSSNESFKQEVTEKYEKVKALAPGNSAPIFTYKDKDGKAVSLADLKGKYVYIDVWATWCGPCIREIPSLKKMEEAYSKKNIQFVSVSIDVEKDYDKWQQMIVDKELTGIQLFAEGDWNSQLATDYSIESIPRFILIDPNGLIISADARRPSDPELAKQFDGFGGMQ